MLPFLSLSVHGVLKLDLATCQQLSMSTVVALPLCVLYWRSVQRVFFFMTVSGPMI